MISVCCLALANPSCMLVQKAVEGRCLLCSINFASLVSGSFFYVVVSPFKIISIPIIVEKQEPEM